jgi:hypothetical protein
MGRLFRVVIEAAGYTGMPSDWWIVWLTGGLLVIGVLQATLFLWQLRIINRSVKDTKVSALAAERAANAAEESIKIMTVVTKAQLRPYLIIKEITRDGGHVLPLQFIAKLENAGQTPAYNVQIRDAQILARRGHEPSINLRSEPEYKISLGPKEGSEHIFFIDDMGPKLTTEHLDSISNGILSLLISGRIDYIDTFGSSWFSTFYYVYDKDNVDGGGVTFGSEGNEST